MCPTCAVPLQTLNVSAGKTFLIERCEECLGLFFDPGELEGLLEATVTTAFVIDFQRLNVLANQKLQTHEEVRYRKCPVCSTLMNRVNFGAKSGVVIDSCRGHGVWLDPGELRRLLEWRKAGGKLYHEQVELEKKRQQHKEEEARRARHAQYCAQANASEYTLKDFGSPADNDSLVILSKVFKKLLGL